MRAVLYAYCEVSALHRDNFRYFVAHGLHCVDTHVVVIVNGEATEPMPPTSATCTVLHRPNTGFDFGGWAAGLEVLARHAYSHFVLLNASCRGPCLPGYLRPPVDWVSLFCSKLTGSVKCVGPTINIYKFWAVCQPHVQTYAWAVDGPTLQALWDHGLFRFRANTKVDAIVVQEIGVSSFVLGRGWDIACFVREYDAVASYHPANEAQLRSFNPAADATHGDIAYHGPACFGRILDGHELLFLKNTRGWVLCRSPQVPAAAAPSGSPENPRAEDK